MMTRRGFFGSALPGLAALAPTPPKATGFQVRGVLERDDQGDGYFILGNEIVIATAKDSAIEPQLQAMVDQNIVFSMRPEFA